MFEQRVEPKKMDSPLIEPEQRTGKGTYARRGPPGNKKALKHGYYSLVKLVKSRGGAMDKRTILGKMVVETARQLESDLGGDVSSSPEDAHPGRGYRYPVTASFAGAARRCVDPQGQDSSCLYSPRAARGPKA